MIQNHNCLYCGKLFTDNYACECEESKLKWMSPKEFNDKLIGVLPKKTMTHNDIKPIYLQDLKYVSQSLPKIPHMNHEKLIIDSYINGGWVKVDAYIEFVVELSKEMGIVKPNKSRWRTFTDNVAQYTKELTKSLINAYNQL